MGRDCEYTAVEAVAEKIPDLTPVPNVGKDDSGFLTGSDEEDGDKKPATSRVSQRSETPRGQAIIMPEKKKAKPRSLSRIRASFTRSRQTATLARRIQLT